jgi:hypothetical protein
MFQQPLAPWPRALVAPLAAFASLAASAAVKRVASLGTAAASLAGLLALLGASAVQAQPLAQELVFTSVSPCRVLDTRVSGAPLAPGVGRLVTVIGSSSDFANQGGHPGGCGIPGFIAGVPQVQAVLINLVAVVSVGAGDLRAWSSDQPKPATSVLNYGSGQTIANAVVVPVRQDQEGGDLTLVADVASTNVVGDVMGYFGANGCGGHDSICLGYGAGNPMASTGSDDTAIGVVALSANTTGLNNTAVGTQALGANTSGGSNTALGWKALVANTTAFNNTATGVLALASCTTGGSNTALGVRTLLDLTTGSNNIAIGLNSGANLTAGVNNIYIGSAPPNDEGNTIRIGTPGLHTGTFLAGIYGFTSSSGTPVYVNVGGQLGYTPSSIRYKEEVANMGDVGDILMNLRPVRFRYKPAYDDGSRLLQYGLVAEEVAVVAPGLVDYDPEGRPLLVRYHFVNAMLLAEAQSQHRKTVAQEARIIELEARVAAQQANLERQQARIDRLEAMSGRGRPSRR